MEKTTRRVSIGAAVALLLFILLAGACAVVGPRGEGDAACANVRPVTRLDAVARAEGGQRGISLAPLCRGYFHFQGDNEDDCFILYPPMDPARHWSVASSPGRGALALRYYKGFDVWAASERGVMVRLDRRWCSFPLSVQNSLELFGSD